VWLCYIGLMHMKIIEFSEDARSKLKLHQCDMLRNIRQWKERTLQRVCMIEFVALISFFYAAEDWWHVAENASVVVLVVQ
jgi:hypothetical protein